MPGRKPKFDGPSKVVGFRVPDIKGEKYTEIRKKITNYIDLICNRDTNLISDTESLIDRDTKILKKLIPEFIRLGIEVNLEIDEIDRIKQLYEEIMSA